MFASGISGAKKGVEQLAYVPIAYASYILPVVDVGELIYL